MASTEPIDQAGSRFETGEAVVHPHQGAGTVEMIFTLERDGEPQRYYRIDLVDQDSVLMIPIQRADEIGLRRARGTRDAIRDEFNDVPDELADNYRTRHANLRQRLSSGGPRSLARVLRDLTWREHVGDLTKIDRDLKREARDRLAAELAVSTAMTIEAATRAISSMMADAIEAHETAMAH